MQLKEHVQNVVKRAKTFYSEPGPGHYLLNTRFPASTPKVPPLNSFDLEKQLNEYLDYKLAACLAGIKVKEGLDDDSLPAVYPHFGIAEHSAWLGLEVSLQENTCHPEPAVTDLNDFSMLTLNEQNKWFLYMKASYEHYRKINDGSYFLAVRGIMTPMDLANAARGNELFTDFLLEPEATHRLMSFMVQAARWYYKHLLSWTDDIQGGRVFGLGEGWMPARSMGHLSNDAATLCSEQIYEEFGFAYETQMLEGYDHALYHLHNEKLHYVPRLAQLSGLAMMQFSVDPKTKRPIEDLPRILGACRRRNLMLDATSEQLRKHLGELKEHNVFFQANCKDRKDAEDLIAFVRDRSKPL
ncbi:MAG: hypothetical protein WCI43_02830 [Candidatus Firestonebacteria bacterium]